MTINRLRLCMKYDEDDDRCFSFGYVKNEVHITLYKKFSQINQNHPHNRLYKFWINRNFVVSIFFLIKLN